jgi:hypothetical protein
MTEASPKPRHWFDRDDSRKAVADLDAHYAVLGCGVASERLGTFLDEVHRYQTADASHTLRDGFARLEQDGPTSRAVLKVAVGTWMTFLDPVRALTELIDTYGPDDDGVGWPGVYGRQWCSSVCAPAWQIWIMSHGNLHSSAGLTAAP